MSPSDYRHYLAVQAFFLTLFLAAVYGLQVLGRSVLQMSPLQIILLSLATYRLARIITIDEVALPFRIPFVRVRRRHGHEEEEPRPTGFAHTIGQLITCSGCSGVWVAALLTYAMALAPEWGSLFIVIFGVAGAAHLLDGAANALKRVGRPPE